MDHFILIRRHCHVDSRRLFQCSIELCPTEDTANKCDSRCICSPARFIGFASVVYLIRYMQLESHCFTHKLVIRGDIVPPVISDPPLPIRNQLVNLSVCDEFARARRQIVLKLTIDERSSSCVKRRGTVVKSGEGQGTRRGYPVIYNKFDKDDRCNERGGQSDAISSDATGADRTRGREISV